MDIKKMDIETGTCQASDIQAMNESEFHKLSITQKKEDGGIWLDETNKKALCCKLRALTEIVMGIHKGTHWTVPDGLFEEFVKTQNQWLDFLDGK